MKELQWFIDPIKNHYFDFEGRVTRQAFWMFALMSIIFLVIASMVSETLANIFAVALLLPHLGLTARRLHDIGKSGWWQLIGLIPFMGLLIIIVLLARSGVSGPNEYGADPRVGTSTAVSPETNGTAVSAEYVGSATDSSEQ